MTDMIHIASTPPIPAYLAQPPGEAKGGVIVIHEVWGLADHIKAVAERVAEAGYIALAPDLLSIAHVDTDRLSGFQEALFDPARRNAIQPKMRELMAPVQNPAFATTTVSRLKQCFDYLYELPAAKRRVAVLGFCFGGTYSFSLAMAEPQLKLAIPFYGHCDATADELNRIKCPVRAFYGEQDERLVSQLPELTERMEQAGVDFQYKVYPGSGHAFFNDTNRFTYNAAAARDAWRITLEALQTYVAAQ